MNDYEELLVEMRQCVEDSKTDQERAHERGDEILCDLLRDLGYDGLVDEWELIKKWYA